MPMAYRILSSYLAIAICRTGIAIVYHSMSLWFDINDHRPELETIRQIIHSRDNDKRNLWLSDTIRNLCLNHPNLRANSCELMSLEPLEPLDCFLRPGRSICTWGSVWSSKIGVTENREEHVTEGKCSLRQQAPKHLGWCMLIAKGLWTNQLTIHWHMYIINIYACTVYIINLYISGSTSPA